MAQASQFEQIDTDSDGLVTLADALPRAAGWGIPRPVLERAFSGAVLPLEGGRAAMDATDFARFVSWVEDGGQTKAGLRAWVRCLDLDGDGWCAPAPFSALCTLTRALRPCTGLLRGRREYSRARAVPGSRRAKLGSRARSSLLQRRLICAVVQRERPLTYRTTRTPNHSRSSASARPIFAGGTMRCTPQPLRPRRKPHSRQQPCPPSPRPANQLMAQSSRSPMRSARSGRRTTSTWEGPTLRASSRRRSQAKCRLWLRPVTQQRLRKRAAARAQRRPWWGTAPSPTLSASCSTWPVRGRTRTLARRLPAFQSRAS